MKRQEGKDELKQKIMDVAWELFYEKGYDNTTVKDIIKKAGTSKGGFYYYFKAKDELLNSLYQFFDREYELFYESMDKKQESLVQLKLLSQHVSSFIEGNVSYELLSALYQSQLETRSQIFFLNPNRYYYKLVSKIITEGQSKGEIRDDMTVEELTHHVLILERAILMDWCVRSGEFSLGKEGASSFNLYVDFMIPKEKVDNTLSQ